MDRGSLDRLRDDWGDGDGTESQSRTPAGPRIAGQAATWETGRRAESPSLACDEGIRSEEILRELGLRLRVVRAEISDRVEARYAATA